MIFTLDDPTTLTFDLKINACLEFGMDYQCTEFRVDTSSRYLPRAHTDKQTDATENPTHGRAMATTWVGK